MLGPQSAQGDFDTDFVFEVEEDEAEVENGETLSDESNWEGEEDEEEELTAEEASRRAQMGFGEQARRLRPDAIFVDVINKSATGVLLTPHKCSACG